MEYPLGLASEEHPGTIHGVALYVNDCYTTVMDYSTSADEMENALIEILA